MKSAVFKVEGEGCYMPGNMWLEEEATVACADDGEVAIRKARRVIVGRDFVDELGGGEKVRRRCLKFRVSDVRRVPGSIESEGGGMKKAIKAGTCHICGCTDSTACMIAGVGPCWWVNQAQTLCSNPTCVAAAKEERNCGNTARVAALVLLLAFMALPAMAQNTSLTGTFKTQDQKTPAQANLTQIATIGATPAYGWVELVATDTATMTPRELTFGGITYPPQPVRGWIKADGTLIAPDETSGIKVVPSKSGGGGAGSSPTGLSYCAKIFFSSDAPNRRRAITIEGKHLCKEVPNEITVDWAALPVATITTPAVSYQLQTNAAVSGYEDWSAIPAPANPAALTGRLFFNMATGKFECKDSAGANCIAGGGGIGAHAVLSATHTDSLAASVVTGDLIHGNATPAWARLAGNITTTKKFLTQTGTGAASAAPGWNTIVNGDIAEVAALLDLSDVGPWTSLAAKDQLCRNAGNTAWVNCLAVDIEIANETVTGTTVNRLAKLTGAPSKAMVTATTDNEGAIGIVTGGAGITGSAQVQTVGIATCDFDAATTAGNFVTISTVTAGKCADAGANWSATKQVVGVVLSTNVAAGAFTMKLLTQLPALAVSSPLTMTSAPNKLTFNCLTASGSQAGCLASADWTTFNNKVATTRTLTGGIGIAAIGDLSVDRTVDVDSTETGFMATASLTCGAGAAGRMALVSGGSVVNFCNAAGTPVQAFLAIGNSVGQATAGDSATDFFSAGILATTIGATGIGTYTQGDILYSDAANSLAKLPKNASATRYLSNTGASNNPAWAQVDLANGVNGALPVGNMAASAQEIQIVTAGCNNATAGPAWDLPTSLAPVATCYGTSPHRFGALDFADGASDLTATAHIDLPTGWTGAVDVKTRWFCSAGTCSTNNFVMTLQTVCVADAEGLAAPTYNAVQNFTIAGSATTNNRISNTQTTVTMTGCAADETLFIRAGRAPTNASDTQAGTMTLFDFTLILRRTPQA